MIKGYSLYFQTAVTAKLTQLLYKPWASWRCITCAVWVGLSSTCFSVVALPTLAQTEPLVSNTQNQQTDYYQELDKWMLRAYEGDRDAQFKVGTLFASDEVDKSKAEQAVYWYKQAARQGHIMAQYNLGHHLLSGNGTVKDETIAIEWWLKAAQEDHALAQFNVGRAYYLGIGVDEDHDKSRYWLSRAAQNKEQKSIEVMQQLGWEINLLDHTSMPTETATSSTPATNINDNIANADSETDKAVAMPVALYTDPAIRSVLIWIFDDRDSLEVVKTNNDWLSVRSPVGFPVWVHADYLTTTSTNATVVGNNVNARSVPLISKGTIVGKLNSGQTLSIIEKQDDWYRLTSPNSFVAWVKSEDYNRPATPNQLSESDAKLQNASTQTLESSGATADFNDNAWLFSQAKERYTLQLASFDEPQKVDDFLTASNFSDESKLHRFTATSKDITWTYFLYGNYDSLAKAEAAKIANQQTLAWIRSFGHLQENRCLSWKTKLPTPPELNQYCNQQTEPN